MKQEYRLSAPPILASSCSMNERANSEKLSELTATLIGERPSSLVSSETWDEFDIDPLIIKSSGDSPVDLYKLSDFIVTLNRVARDDDSLRIYAFLSMNVTSLGWRHVVTPARHSISHVQVTFNNANGGPIDQWEKNYTVYCDPHLGTYQSDDLDDIYNDARGVGLSLYGGRFKRC